jgi:shikimate kinase
VFHPWLLFLNCGVAPVQPMNIFLIGYRGCGKTTVARHLSQQLGWPWLDADTVLEERAGKSIKQIFADSGEAAFRELESAVVAELAGLEGHVIALGGGAILRAENRSALAGRGLVVWLEASPETLWERITADPASAERRPNLTGQGGLAEIRALLDERTPLYRQCADLALDAERLAPAQIARDIVRFHSQRNLQRTPKRNPA